MRKLGPNCEDEHFGGYSTYLLKLALQQLGLHLK